MDELNFISPLYMLFAGIAIVLFILALVGTARSARWRIPLVVIFFTAVLGFNYYALGSLLGLPKPVDIMTWDRPDVEEATVMAQFHRKDEAIYLLLMYEGLKAPRYFQFPWDEDMSRQLKKAEQGHKMKENQGIKLKLPFQHSWEDRKFPEVYPIPWPAPPAKDRPPVEIRNLDTIDA